VVGVRPFDGFFHRTTTSCIGLSSRAGVMKAPAPFAQVMKRLRNARQPNGRRPTGACGLVPSQQRWDGWPVQVDTHWQSNETNEIIMTSTLLSCTYVRLYEQSNALSKAMATAMPDEQ